MNAADLTDQSNWPNVRKSAEHLQRCIMALEKIKSIAGPGPISQIANDAMLNKPWNAGGGDY